MASILKVDTIQDQAGNNIISENANVITIGASGDTITIPSGATLANSGIVTGFESTGIDDNATSTAITIDSSENVGIGTSNPSHELDIQSSGDVTQQLKTTSSSNNAISFLDGGVNADSAHRLLGDGTTYYSLFRDGSLSNDLRLFSHTDTAGGTDILKYSINGDLRFGTNASERMRIDSSGNVGIGTSTPSARVNILESTVGTDPTADSSNFIKLTNNDIGTINEVFGIGFSSLSGGTDYLGAFVQALGNYSLNFNHSLIFGTRGTSGNATERMRIDSSGNVGIGTSSPSQILHVEASGTNPYIRVTETGNTGIDFGQETNGNGVINLRDSAALRLFTGGSERMRIDSSGNVLIGTTNTSSLSGEGHKFYGYGGGAHVGDGSVIGGGHVLVVNRLDNDGNLVGFYQAGSQEGYIAVSGSTVSYNGFTGTHWSRFQDNSAPTILRGTVLETLDEMCDWYNLEFNDNDGNSQKIPYVLQDGQSNGDVITYDWNTEKKDENDNDIIEQVQATIVKETDIKHMKSKVSDTVDAKNVYGVFYAWDNEDSEGYNDFTVASVGSFVVRIKANETIAKGDLLQSNGDGTAKVQTDDAVRSSSFAKVLSTTIIETYDDGSYLVPCSLMC